MSLAKPSRVVDRQILEKKRLTPCIICRAQPSDPCHVKSRGSGGGDEDYNVYPACRLHHQEQHRIGIVTFARRHWALYEWLLLNGWVIENGKIIRAEHSAVL